MKRSFISALVAGRYYPALMRKSVSTAKATASAFTEALATKRSSLFERMKLRWTTSANSTREKDIALLVKLSERCRDLEHLKFHEKHKVHELSAEIRNHITELFLEHDGSLEANNKIFSRLLLRVNELYRDSESALSQIDDNSPEASFEFSASLRLLLLQNYLSTLSKVISEDQLPWSTITEKRLTLLCEAHIRGSGSERVAEHMAMYKEALTLAELQECYFALCDPEVETVKTVLLSLPGLLKDHKKKIPKFSKFYLLDFPEVTVKARCVFAWSDPDFKNFKPLADDHRVPLATLIRSTDEFFPDLKRVGRKYVDHYKGERALHYADKDEMKEYRRYGFVFFVCTVLLDGYLMGV